MSSRRPLYCGRAGSDVMGCRRPTIGVFILYASDTSHTEGVPHSDPYNNYIDPSVQKGEIPGALSCLEHTGVVTQLIREAHENRGDLVVLWLNLANAYGSIPHKLVEIALLLQHVHSMIKDLILDYYNNFRMRVTSGS